MNIDFYTGPQCSLCDDALRLIHELNDTSLVVNKMNIREHSDLYHLYAVRIPVIKLTSPNTHKHCGKELGWPFDIEQLRAFLA
jgi:hypothetical protein